MATKELVFEQITRLSRAHRVKLDEALVHEYYKVLGACLPEDLISAADEMIANNKYFPKVAEIWQASENALIRRLTVKHGANVNISGNVQRAQHDYRSYAEDA
jgi:hypothetical protein